STYLGGSGDDQASALQVDPQGNVVVIGYTTSTNFPTTNGIDKTITGSYDEFVAKLDPTGSQLLYSSYVGGSVSSGGLVLDASGNAYLTGSATTGPRLTASTGAYKSPQSGGRDGFVLKLSPSGALVYNAVI